ncbi:hypothetical protein COCCADRAFT_101770 [Bipolaris zeicola 26-R-13]|uniref:Uncharacterized protein n=1 Tax=Cochliobolus carbonum (strain 26-R-13) TaxID=930089 RepID=W6Y7I7_COCC2|nr:uncharacterized protein COCCADRAFT_101770 [Bipolaris zeicola 26-R-13]EUC31249.1 hypothetical protein COCCADRAFT_101770 [Bipolaris zeicola 26-R-13]
MSVLSIVILRPSPAHFPILCCSFACLLVFPFFSTSSPLCCILIPPPPDPARCPSSPGNLHSASSPQPRRRRRRPGAARVRLGKKPHNQ